MGLCTSKTSQTTKVDPAVKDASNLLIQKATDAANADVTMPTLQIADLNADQQAAAQKTRDLDPNISTERVVDENGKLGAINDYINPYVDNALKPTYEAIERASDAQRKQLGASATSAEAFGDARHGVVESGINRNEIESTRNAAYQGYSDAFDKAMTLRGADLTRFTDVDKTNFQQALQSIAALTASGNQQQGEEQAKNQAVFDQFLAQYGHDFDVMNALSAAIGGSKFDVTTTGKTDSGAIMSLLGAALGGFSSGAGGAVGKAAVASDIRLKRDIIAVGNLPSGLPVYFFRYLDEERGRMGVMAHEAREFHPEAVIEREDGYLMVDYSKIG